MTVKTIKSPEEIRWILSSPEWTVKTPGHEVPMGILDSCAGDMYGRFARMTDSVRHHTLRGITEEVVSALDMTSIPDEVETSFSLIKNPTPRDMQILVPGMCIAGLLGVPPDERLLLVTLIRDFVEGARDTAGSEKSASAIVAVERMLPIIRQWPEPTDDADKIASRTALLYQTLDAVAALVGNAIVAFADEPFGDPARIVEESMARRVPVRSTTRVRGDSRVVLDLEAAHTVEPDAQWTFGYGTHRCPGSSLAIGIAVEIIRFIQEGGLFQPDDIVQQGWEPLPNVWIPVLSLAEEGYR